MDFALALDCVRGVYPQLLPLPLPSAPPFLKEVVEIYGEPVCVLDLGARLDLPHSCPLLERKLIVARCGEVSLALTVDRILDPQEIAPEDVLPRERLGGTEHPPLHEILLSLVRTRDRLLPVLRPEALVTPELLSRVPEMLRALAASAEGARR